MKNIKVVVIGGGYGGLCAIENLTTYPDTSITLIDKNPYHYLQTELYGYIAGKLNIDDIAIDLQHWSNGFKNVKFLHKEVTDIDMDKKSIVMGKENLSYDYLIVATGARTHFFSFITGLEQHTHGIKTLQRAYEFRRTFEDTIYNTLEEEMPIPLNIVIGGAGLSGVEIAAEMAHVTQSYSKTIGAKTNRIQIYLIDAAESILPGMDEYIISQTYKRLKNLNITILTSTKIVKVDDTHIYLMDKEALTYTFVVFTGGIMAQTPHKSQIFQKNKFNQYIPTKTLNIEGYDTVFTIGDCTEIRNKQGDVLAPTAQLAEQSAMYVSKAIKLHTKAQHLEVFDTTTKGVFIALGGRYAVGQIYHYFKVKGYVAYLLKKALASLYYLGLKLRINTGFRNRIREGPT
jgi:NADH dehydrogenase